MEYKYTLDDLRKMQKWSFSHKIGVAQTRIFEWYSRFNGKVAVNYSGGKDSSVLLDLARRIYSDIPVVFCDTGLEFPEVVSSVKAQENITILKPQFCKVCTNCKDGCFPKIVQVHGWNFPSKDVAKTIKYARRGAEWAIKAMNGVKADGSPSKFRESTFGRWRFLLDSDIKISDECCNILKEKPLNDWHKETGYKPIIGTMAEESRRRREAWQHTGCNAFDSKKQVSKPLSFWTEQDILRYILEYNVPYASVYGEILEDKKTHKLYTTKEKRTGCILCPCGYHLDKINKFERLKISHPKLFDYAANTLKLSKLFDIVERNKQETKIKKIHIN